MEEMAVTIQIHHALDTTLEVVELEVMLHLLTLPLLLLLLLLVLQIQPFPIQEFMRFLAEEMAEMVATPIR
jgi:hypothetical protein